MGWGEAGVGRDEAGLGGVGLDGAGLDGAGRHGSRPHLPVIDGAAATVQDGTNFLTTQDFHVNITHAYRKYHVKKKIDDPSFISISWIYRPTYD